MNVSPAQRGAGRWTGERRRGARRTGERHAERTANQPALPARQPGECVAPSRVSERPSGLNRNSGHASAKKYGVDAAATLLKVRVHK
jgi:hypothetical protein